MLNINISETIEIFQKMTNIAKENNAINLSQGIPNNIYDTLWQNEVCNQTKNHWQYTPIDGDYEFIQQVNLLYNNIYDKNITITSGCTEALIAALFSFKSQGFKQIIVAEPFYPYYRGMAEMAGLVWQTSPMLIEQGKIALDIDDLNEKLKLGKSVLLINSPHNPTGHVVSTAEWSHIKNIITHNHAALLIDDVYRDFCFNDTTIPYQELTALNTLVAGSISKSLAGCGVRLGWIAGTPSSLAIAKSAHSHMSNCLPEILQRAASNLLKKYHVSESHRVNKCYQARRDHLYHTLRISGFEALRPQGGHFIMARWLENQDMSATEQCYALTRMIGVTPLPMDAFFTENKEQWLRFSYAVSDDAMETACTRINTLWSQRDNE
ncbi:pyridoxal phosphate-dependent aminotransferase [Vibrio ruber]|uniref:pyridoxal phosphate-dependent aminotransferase n=1 Tax=Vibrio ruber TaxID=184755 RepID=UPI0028933076|nr:pyridoxal phosphate-dependent aminotransferase [Vibrio ruber]WNJ96291.1 pyridoxal phosphate-dependent aminotransferase [Vibrio ruber]